MIKKAGSNLHFGTQAECKVAFRVAEAVGGTSAASVIVTARCPTFIKSCNYYQKFINLNFRQLYLCVPALGLSTR